MQVQTVAPGGVKNARTAWLLPGAHSTVGLPSPQLVRGPSRLCFVIKSLEETTSAGSLTYTGRSKEDHRSKGQIEQLDVKNKVKAVTR